MGAGRRLAAAALALALAAGGYVVADVADVVPGPLTDAPLPTPTPLPAAAGATLPVADTPAVLDAVDADDPGEAPADPAAVAAVVGPLVTAPALGRRVSASVVDAVTGTTLLDAGAATPVEPASVAKILTAAAVLDRLGPGATLPTRAVRGLTDDEVILLAGGDVLLAAGPPALPQAEVATEGSTAPRARLDDLAEATAAALLAEGRTTVAVRVDDSLFEPERLAPGVGSVDVRAGFTAPLTAVAVDAGRTEPGRYAPRTDDPALAAARTFAALLAERGVTVVGEQVREVAPEEPEVLAEVRSAPLAEQVVTMLTSSDNVLADALARLVAVDMGRPARFADSGRAVLDVVAALGVDTTGAVLADGSGLGDGSALPARVLTGTLAAAASPEHPRLRPLLEGLPVAGLTGTLADRFVVGAAGEGDGGGPVAGRVRAKTGSLTGTTSLAGVVVDADGRLLAFAVLADAVPAIGPARVAVDAVATALAGCGCRAGPR